MNIDAQKVIDRLKSQVGELFYQNTLLQMQLEEANEEIVKLKEQKNNQENAED